MAATASVWEALLRPLKPEAQQIVLEDFRSNEPSRQQKAAQLLAGIGPATIPMLIEVVKSGGDLRIRRLATSLLAEQGVEGRSTEEGLDPSDHV